MEAVIKINVIDDHEEDWALDKYAKGKFKNLTNKHLTEVVADIIRDALADNNIYNDYDDDEIENAVQEILPTISSIILNPRFSHLKMEYNLLVEIVTYLTVRLA